MDKEKEIQELARDMCHFTNIECKQCCCNDLCVYADSAEMIYAAGYRKADEVRKEVLDEFYNTHYCAYFSDDTVKEPCLQSPCPHFKGAEDIRKETAIKILDEVHKYIKDLCSYEAEDYSEWVREFAKEKYGVEIDE